MKLPIDLIAITFNNTFLWTLQRLLAESIAIRRIIHSNDQSECEDLINPSNCDPGSTLILWEHDGFQDISYWLWLIFRSKALSPLIILGFSNKKGFACQSRDRKCLLENYPHQHIYLRKPLKLYQLLDVIDFIEPIHAEGTLEEIGKSCSSSERILKHEIEHNILNGLSKNNLSARKESLKIIIYKILPCTRIQIEQAALDKMLKNFFDVRYYEENKKFLEDLCNQAQGIIDKKESN